MTLQDRLDALKQQLRQQEHVLCQLQGAIAVVEDLLKEQSGNSLDTTPSTMPAEATDE